MYCYQMHCVNSIKIFTIKALFPSEVDDSHEFQYNATKWIRELFYISKYDKAWFLWILFHKAHLSFTCKSDNIYKINLPFTQP